ncbi:DUF4190 domain-containing protein [Actinomadura opuntiae]|uniref:DUF4190 domain-containing protein n=1 Tax=Actinomadura sp. OS1-43 TaxID=604315 RepID=UPI00255B18BE|nr:DUF4190 domain-containing protein [Actinomadura sp. OS1-43]MDL4814819.1 DUF4190 domain-containing protein [Actinomadura sp. OS1-43]
MIVADTGVAASLPVSFSSGPGQPNPWARPAAPPPRDGTLPPQTSGLAIAAFVTGLLGCCSILGIVLGVVALNQIKQRGDKGRGLAIAGIVLSALWTVGSVAGYLALSRSGSSYADLSTVPRPTVTGTKKIDAQTMRIGDCIDDPAMAGAPAGDTVPPVQVEDVKIVPCDGPHDGEVLDAFTLEETAMPAEEEMQRLAADGCKRRVESRIDRDPDSEQLTMSYYYPTGVSWRLGDRGVTCLAVNAAVGRKLTGRIRG